MDQTPTDPPGPGSTRRRFLARVGGLFGLAVTAPRLLTADDEPVRIRQTEGSDRGSGSGPAPALPPVFDVHTHRGLFAAEGTPLYPGDQAGAATVEDGLESGLAAAFFSLIGDMTIIEIDSRSGPRPTRAYEPGEAWEEHRRQMRVACTLLARTPASLATGAGRVSTDPDRSQVAAFLALEGGDALGSRPERLETTYDDGVRSVQLVHYAPNDLGDLQTAPARFGGLSEVGREVVAGMNRLGMVVDVAHASFETTVDAAEASDDPLILSHSHLKTGGDDPMQPRLITPEHARVVADTGGVIGMWPDGLRRSGLIDDELAGVLGGNALRTVEGVIGAGPASMNRTGRTPTGNG